jgi:hypothetical protein
MTHHHPTTEQWLAEQQSRAGVSDELLAGAMGYESARVIGMFKNGQMRVAHAHPQGLGLVRSGNGAAVVVAQNDHRPMLEVRPEYPFTTDVEIVAIHQRVHSDLQPGIQSEYSGYA